MKTWQALMVIAAGVAGAHGAQADSLRCGSKLVTEQDTREQVRIKCGEAAEVQQSSIWRVPVVWVNGRPYHLSREPAEVPVELWIYNFGPRKLMRRVRFEDGLVVDIETLGYGYLK